MINIPSYDEVELFYKYAKVMKCEYMMYKDGRIFGSDLSFAHLCTLDLNNVELNIPDGFLLSKIGKEISVISDGRDPEYLQFIDLLRRFKFVNYINQISIYNLENDEQFKSMMDKKSSMGMTTINYNGFVMTLCKSLIPVNKNDKVNLIIKDMGSMFMGEFTIYKGKNILTEYYLFLSVK